MKKNRKSFIILKALGIVLNITLLVLTGFVLGKDGLGRVFTLYILTLLFTTFLLVISIIVEFNDNYNEEIIMDKLQKTIDGNYNTRIYVKGKGLKVDIATRFNELIEILQKNEEEYRTLEESRRRLLSNISHDIRTPLTSIIGYVDALKDGIPADDNEEEEYVEIISTKAKKLKSLINEIFQMAKLDADDISMNFEIHDLGEIIRECIIEFLPQVNKEDIKLEINVTQERLPVYVDKLSIYRVIENLLKNGIIHGREGKILGVEVTSLEKSYKVVVYDRGPGIPKEEISHVFDRLYTGDKTRKGNTRGSGLGLSITKKLIEKHSGSIWVNSIPFENTEFVFTLPKL